jgi:glycerol-3-phosphate dehydrogenase
MNIIKIQRSSLLRNLLYNNSSINNKNIKCLPSIRFHSHKNIDKRKAMLDKLKNMHINKEELDVIIIGGGSVGCGSALDASLRGLDVACFEREDFASGTSSRSTKLIWGGSRYLVMALVDLFNFDLRLFRHPFKTINKFVESFKMVLNCHRERKFLLETQPHLTNWIPIAVPLIKWIQWPPPFGFPPAVFGAFGLYSIFFKFYDGLSGFTCPPSHVMTRRRAMRKFPQLANQQIKYCPIFYEGQHDDARTNLSIALTATEEGAKMLNYCEIIELIRNDNNKAIGVIVKNLLTNEIFEVRSKTILFCGGPFTDELRKLEDKNVKNAVNGAGGIHIVLPSYFAPSGIGLVDMSTSDGRFLFLLPWQGHVLVGTTDHFSEACMRPEPDESEIRWLLTEASKYLSPELRLRRQDVISAWKGIRPLASDPNVDQSVDSSSISRDHVISYNKESGIVFIAGGKWTTYREMAEDAIDYLIKTSEPLQNKTIQPCSTLTKHLVGFDGYTSNLHIRLIQEFGVASSVATRLARAYGGNAYEVLTIARDELGSIGRGDRLFPGYPYIEAEVIYAVRNEFAVTADGKDY